MKCVNVIITIFDKRMCLNGLLGPFVLDFFEKKSIFLIKKSLFIFVVYVLDLKKNPFC